MNDVPLIQKADINSINTSIIAIKKQLKQLNEALGLVDVPSIDTSVFVKKSDVVDVVEAGNMNPVTSNAVAEVADSLEPVDEVTSSNMHSVTSNAVADAVKLVPDYAQGNLVTNGSTSYTPSEDVYLMYCIIASSNDARLSIGGVNNLCCYASYGGIWTITFNGIVKKGTVITRVDNGNFDTRSIKAFKLKRL